MSKSPDINNLPNIPEESMFTYLQGIFERGTMEAQIELGAIYNSNRLYLACSSNENAPQLNGNFQVSASLYMGIGIAELILKNIRSNTNRRVSLHGIAAVHERHTTFYDLPIDHEAKALILVTSLGEASLAMSVHEASTSPPIRDLPIEVIEGIMRTTSLKIAEAAIILEE